MSNVLTARIVALCDLFFFFSFHKYDFISLEDKPNFMSLNALMYDFLFTYMYKRNFNYFTCMENRHNC